MNKEIEDRGWGVGLGGKKKGRKKIKKEIKTNFTLI